MASKDLSGRGRYYECASPSQGYLGVGLGALVQKDKGWQCQGTQVYLIPWALSHIPTSSNPEMEPQGPWAQPMRQDLGGWGCRGGTSLGTDPGRGWAVAL